MEGKTVKEIIEKQNLTFTGFSRIIKNLYEKRLIRIGG
jgi:DNA-binding MarR family transcriptional regulator